MNFGQRLLSLRKQKGLSQDELGSQLNVSRQTVSKWELGETTPEMNKLILISELFHVSLDDLLKGSNVSDNQADEDPSKIKVSEKDTSKKGFYNILALVVKIIGAIFIIDFIVMIIYFVLNGFPT